MDGDLLKALEGLERFEVKGAAVPHSTASGIVVQSGKMIQFPGMIGLDGKGLNEDAYSQTVNILENIAREIAERAGLGGIDASKEALKLVTSGTAYVVSLSKYGSAVEKAYSERVQTAPTLVGVKELPRGALVQIVASALIPNYTPPPER